MTLFHNRAARLLTLLLVVQGGAYYAVALRQETASPATPLSDFTRQSKEWMTVKEYEIDKETQTVLRADDTLNRSYINLVSRKQASLFIAFFKTQRYGQAPHSPKNCLPGSGWEPKEAGTIQIDVPDWQTPITINKYIVARGDQQTVVFYWYHSHSRVIASEYFAKMWLVLDAIHYRRSDTSLVRVLIPVGDDHADAAVQTGVDFIRALFPDLVHWFPQ